MKKKRLFKSLVLLFSSSLALGTFLSLQFAHKKDNANVVLAYEGTPLPTSGTLSAGTYYLSGNLTVSSQLKITSGDVIVNLNGYTLNGGGRDKGIFHVTGGTLTVNGKDDVTGKRGALNDGGGYYPGSGYSYGGALYITAGGATFNDLDITKCQSNWGGAISMSNSAVTLNNCNLSKNMDTNGYGFYGVIRVGDSSSAGQGLTVNGGEMFSNDGAISVGNNAKVTINGAHIHDNEKLGVTVDTEGSLKISGNTIIEDNQPSSFRNLVLNNPAKVEITSPLGENASIGVTLNNNTGVFTSGWSTVMGDAKPSDYFFSDNSSYAVDLQDGEACLIEPVASVSVGESVTTYANITSAVSAWNSAASGATLTLLKDVTVSSTINVSTTKTLDLNGCGIITTSTDSLFLINNGGNLTLNDSGDTTHYFTHERYKGYDAGLATICDKATYDEASEDSRGTFSGGYITGLHITADSPVARGAFRVESGATLTMNGGTIIGNYSDNSASGVCSDGVFVMNGGNMIYNTNRQGAINPRYGTLVINGGNISHNIGKNDKNIGRGAAILQYVTVDCTIRGGTITNNVARQGAIASQCNIAIEGDPLIKDNIAVGEDGNSDDPMNILLCLEHESKLVFTGEFTGEDPIGVTIDMPDVCDVTDSTDVSFNDKNNVVSDNPDYAIGMYPSNHAKAGQLYIKGVETINVIDQIDNIDPLSYDGGKNDSLDDIVTAINDYNNLPQNEKDFVDEINKDVLDHDTLVYKHVDKAGDLIKEIPEPSDSQEYFDAVDAALATYNALTDEEEAILNADLDFPYKKALDDNIAVKEVIELIKDIGDVTYKGGQDDSKDDINDAFDAYNNLTDDLKAIVDNANKDELDDAKETYDNVDKAVNLINSIGDINHGGENDSKDAIDAARETYDNLSDEEKALVGSYNDSTQALKDAEEVYDVLVKIDDIGEVSADSGDKIAAAREAYETLSDEQKEKVNSEALNTLKTAEAKYLTNKQDAELVFRILLIISIILIVTGLLVLSVLLKNRANNKKKLVNACSFAGFLPPLVFVSDFSDSKFIIVYILLGLAILIWTANFILVLIRNRVKEPKVMANSATQVESRVDTLPPVLMNLNNEEDEVVTTTDEKGSIFQIRYIKSFKAKLIQSPDETKKYYEELKNEVLSYKKTSSRISWYYDSINSGRNQVLKFAVRGKTLCVYLPLNADEYLDSKYKVEKVESKKYEDVPCLFRIKNEKRLGYAKELIAVVAANLSLEKDEAQSEVYSDLPYEPNKPLIEKGLIKEVKSNVQDKEVIKHYESISVSKADEEMSDEKAESSIEEVEVIKPRKGRKEIINIDTLSENYNNGDEVTLESLIKKGLVPATTGHIKVLARGVLDKKLDVIANDFSIPAIKMIVLVGGHVKKIK